MAKRMLIDAAHPEETRVVVTSGHRLEEFDFESSTKKQVKGNIYLAKITRVEPSLQAAFVDYGGNRHGFLAFSEIHPDYYRIPVSDRPSGEGEPLPESGSTPEDGGEDAGVSLAAALPEPVPMPPSAAAEDEPASEEPALDAFGADADPMAPTSDANEPVPVDERPPAAERTSEDPPDTAKSEYPDDGFTWKPEDLGIGTHGEAESFMADLSVMPDPDTAAEDGEKRGTDETPSEEGVPEAMALRTAEEALLTAEIGELAENRHYRSNDAENDVEGQSVETLGGDEVEEVEEADAERRRWHSARHYKIQEVIKRRQIMLVQVAKEERGNKGAALTTYLSLAGRYCVLMPNTGRGGGVSRKISSLADRRRLKDILEDLDIPEGMGVIVRTAGAERSKPEIKRDYEYLLRLWNEIRDLTLKSTAPALIYEEGNLIKRSIRDLYTRDLDEVLVEGEEGYKTAKAFMRTLMPSHAKRVQPYRDPEIGLFHRFQIESQIDAIHSPVVQLRSGGYLVINQTEALVAIDVNSGRSTRERNIEETALRTNLEAADEIARQLRLRDLAGLIVIDFIDMDEHRNQVSVERRVKEALKSDRARIQVGRISPFGLLEMSRQRLRPSLAEASTQPCPHCGGTGSIRSVESTALYVLRSIEEEGIRRRSAEICVYVPTNVALYILNQKRESLGQIEARYGLRVTLASDDSLIPPNFRIERLRPYEPGEAPPPRAIQAPIVAEEEGEDEQEEVGESAAVAGEAAGPEQESEEDRARRRRRRRRRPDKPREPRPGAAAPATREPGTTAEPDERSSKPAGEDEEKEREAEAERRRRRRGRRGGRTRPRREEAAETAASGAMVAAETIEIVSAAADAAGEERIDRAEEMMPAPTPWPFDAGVEPTSLTPLAGESAQPVPMFEGRHADETDAAATGAEPVPIGDAGEGIPFISETERAFEQAPAEAAPVHHEEPISEVRPVIGETERVFEEAAAEAAPVQQEEPIPEPLARPSEELRTVTEKPANPRRGWWQRLMQ
jgi:ribonuclease E